MSVSQTKAKEQLLLLALRRSSGSTPGGVAAAEQQHPGGCCGSRAAAGISKISGEACKPLTSSSSMACRAASFTTLSCCLQPGAGDEGAPQS